MKTKIIKKVTPFGNSGHLNISKRDVGKYFKIESVFPLQEALSVKEISTIREQLKEELKTEPSGFTNSIYKHCIKVYEENLEELEEEDSIDGIISFLMKNEEKHNENKGIIEKLKKLSDGWDED